MDSYSVTNDTKEIDYKLLHIHHHGKVFNTPVSDIVTSTVPFSISQTLTTSSNKSATFNLIAPIPDFAIAFASPERDTDNSFKKSNTIKADSYIDSAYEKSQIVRFKNEILQNLQGDIKKLLDSEFKFFKSRCDDLDVK